RRQRISGIAALERALRQGRERGYRGIDVDQAAERDDRGTASADLLLRPAACGGNDRYQQAEHQGQLEIGGPDRRRRQILVLREAAPDEQARRQNRDRQRGNRDPQE